MFSERASVSSIIKNFQDIVNEIKTTRNTLNENVSTELFLESRDLKAIVQREIDLGGISNQREFFLSPIAEDWGVHTRKKLYLRLQNLALVFLSYLKS